MKAEENQQRRFDSLSREHSGQDREDQGKAEVVSQYMMIVAPLVQRMGGIWGQPFSDNSQTIDVRASQAEMLTVTSRP